MKENQLTLTEIAKKLQEPQHRLIYLCEKGVIVPDGSDAKGRGSSRRFSSRNLFEFAVALTLGEFHIPAAVSQKILSTIRLFEKNVKQSIMNFNIPNSLADSKAPTIYIVLTHGSCLSFALGYTEKSMKIIGSVNLTEPFQEMNLSLTESKIETMGKLLNQNSRFTNNISHAYFLLNLSKIAQELQV